MKSLLRNILLSAALTSGVAVSYATLTPEQYCDPKITAVPGIKDIHPMADGESYSAMNDEGTIIELFSYKTGKKTGTVMDVNSIKGDLKIDSFEGYTMSENEKKILLWRDSKKVYRYSFFAEYYVYDISRQTLKRVSTGGPQRGAVLSHDGRMVAYMRDNNIFISNLDYETDNAITKDGKVGEIINGIPDWGYEEEFGILNTIRFSADDNTLAFIRFDESKVPVYKFDNYRSYCDEDPDGDLYPAQYSYKYPLAGYATAVVKVLAYDINNKTTKIMDLPMEEADYIPSLEFDGRGEKLMVMVVNHDQNRLRLYVANPGSTVCKMILEETSAAWLNPEAYQMVDYASDSFIIGSERSGYRHLYKYDYSGNLQKQVTSGDFNVTAYYGSDSRLGRTYFQCTKLGAINRNVAYADKTGITLLANQPGWETASFSKGAKYYVRSYSNASTPTQYTVYNFKGSKVCDLNLNQEYASTYSSAPKREFMKVPNAAGEEMDGCIIKPADFDASKRYPVLMYQYNGPGSQEVQNRWKMDGLYYIASQGYLVVTVDGRGTGFRDRKWCDAVYKNLGKYETLDQIAGAKWMASQTYVDAEKLACFGWSYGGYMTLMELSEPGNPFKAGVSMAPVVDWRMYDAIYTERFMLTPGQNPEGYRNSSALLRSENMNKKLLIMSGSSDDNVHYYNTLKYTSKLGKEGTLCDMMTWTGFDHSLRECNARTVLYRKVVEFLNKNL